MLEGLKEALQYVVNLGNDAEKVQVLEICGETYANKRLERYGAPKSCLLYTSDAADEQ